MNRRRLLLGIAATGVLLKVVPTSMLLKLRLDDIFAVGNMADAVRMAGPL
jgi:hypothetical protein